MFSSWVIGILRPRKIISKVMIVSVGPNVAKTIVETKHEKYVMANLLL